MRASQNHIPALLSAFLFSFSTLAETLEQAGRLSTIQPAVIVAMSLLAIGLFTILVLSNRKLRKAIALPLTDSTRDSQTNNGHVRANP